MADDPTFSLPGEYCYLLFSPLCVADPSFYVRCELDQWEGTTPVANQRGTDLATKLEPLLFNLPHAITFPACPQAPTVSAIASQIRDHIAVIVNRVTEICWTVNVQTGRVLPLAEIPDWMAPIQAMPAGDGPVHRFCLDNTERAAVEAQMEMRWEELVIERAGDDDMGGRILRLRPGRQYDLYFSPLTAFPISSAYLKCAFSEWQPRLPIMEQRGIELATQLQPLLVGQNHGVTFPGRLEDTTVSTILSQIRDGMAVIKDRDLKVYFCASARTGKILPWTVRPAWVPVSFGLPQGKSQVMEAEQRINTEWLHDLQAIAENVVQLAENQSELSDLQPRQEALAFLVRTRDALRSRVAERAAHDAVVQIESMPIGDPEELEQREREEGIANVLKYRWECEERARRALLQAIQRGSNSMMESLNPDTARACTYFWTRQEMLVALPAFIAVDDGGGGGGSGGEEGEGGGGGREGRGGRGGGGGGGGGGRGRGRGTPASSTSHT